MSAQDEKELLEAHRARLRAIVAGDLDTLNGYVSEDLVYTSPNGHTMNKQQVFEGFRSGVAKVDKMETDETEVRLYGNTAIVTYRANTKMSDGINETTGYIRSTATYVKEPSGWRLVSQHQSRIE